MEKLNKLAYLAFGWFIGLFATIQSDILIFRYSATLILDVVANICARQFLREADTNEIKLVARYVFCNLNWFPVW